MGLKFDSGKGYRETIEIFEKETSISIEEQKLKKRSDSSVTLFILQTVKKEHPETVEQLIELVHEKYSIPKNKIMEHILDLQSEGKLKLSAREYPEPILSASKYFFSKQARWYWIVVILTFATISAIFFVSEELTPLLYLRQALGSIFVLYLPGYCLIEALFPERKIDMIERIALAIGINLAVVSINGLILNYTPWGITLTSVTLSLALLTITFSTIAIFRKYKMQSKKVEKLFSQELSAHLT